MKRIAKVLSPSLALLSLAWTLDASAAPAQRSQTASKKPNVIVIMTDDVGFMDLGSYGGGALRGAPTPNLDRMAAEGMRFTTYYGQPTCTLGRASFLTGRYPMRSGMLGVLVPGSPNGLYADEPNIAQTLKKAGYTTVQLGKWHLGDKPQFYPTSIGFDEMHHMLPYYANVYTYDDPEYYPDFPLKVPAYQRWWKSVNRQEWDGVAGQPARALRTFVTKDLATVDHEMRDTAITWLTKHARDQKPFFMYLNFMKMHNPTVVDPEWKGKSPGKYPYTDGLMELDDNSGKVLQAVRDLGIDEDTLVIWTTDNGAWIDTWPDAGLQPFRGEKSSAFEGGVRVPCIARWPGHIKPGSVNNDIWTHMDWYPTVASLAGLPAPPRYWRDNKGKPIVFDGIDLHDSLLGTGPGQRDQFIYINAGGGFQGVREGRFKALWTSHDSWLGVSREQTLPAVYDLMIDPFEQHDIMFMGSAPTYDALRTSPGRSPLRDHGWIFVSLNTIVTDFFAELKKYPNRPEPAAGETLYRAIKPVFEE